jgi:hypothetical protein
MTLSDTTNLSVHSHKPTMDERKRSIQPDSDDIYPSKRHQTTQNAPQMRMDSEKEKDVEVSLLSLPSNLHVTLSINTVNSRSRKTPSSAR